MSNIYLKKGHLLIAEPSIIGDLSFNRSIIIIADHNYRRLYRIYFKQAIRFYPSRFNS